MFTQPSTRNNVLRAFVLFIIMFVLLGVMAIQASAKSDRSQTSGIKATSNFKQPTKVIRKNKTVKKARTSKTKYVKRVAKTHSVKTRSLRPPLRRSSMRVVGRSNGLHPRLRYLLTKVRSHYGRSIVVTSGCRSYRHNRRIGGAKRSMHLKCMAADIKVSGVSKGSLRRYVASMAGRGGVGTYCGRSIVHLDVGPRRSWYHGCGTRRAKSRGKSRRKG